MEKLTNDKRMIRGIKELAHYIGCGYNSAWRIANEGKIPGWKIGKVFCWDADVVDNVLESGAKL